MLFIINIYSKRAWVVPLECNKGITITNAFQKIFNESCHKPSKIRVDKGSKIYNRSMKAWLEKMLKKCIPHTMKENLLLRKDLLEP